MRETERLYKLSCRNRLDKHIQTIRWQTFKRVRHEFDKVLKKKKCAYRKGIMLSMEGCNTTNPNEFWDFVRKLGPTKKNDIPWEIEVNGEKITDKEVILEKWRTDYQHLYTVKHCGFDEKSKSDKLKELGTKISEGTPHEELNLVPTYGEVQNTVNASKTKKSVGLDWISNELLKNATVVQLLHRLFAACWKNRLIPSLWRKSILHQIPKSNECTSDPLKYRGLALQSCVFKILCHIINQRVVRHLDSTDLLVDKQNGFRKKCSCGHHIHSLVTIVQTRMLHSKETHTCFIDFRKAFDVVDRDLLRYKLLDCGIMGTLYHMIDQMYSDTRNVIRLNNHYSNEFNSSHGVMQGNNLSPTCFSIYINGLLKELNKSNIGVVCNNRVISHLAYADDIVLLAETSENLQKLLDVVHRWCKQWRVLINVSKSKTMIFSHRGSQGSQYKPLWLGDEQLEKVSSYRYLGITLDEWLTMELAVDQLAKAGSCALWQIIGKTKENYDLGFASFKKLCESCLYPILDYAHGSWGCEGNYHELDQVELRAMHFYCGLPRNTPIVGILREMNWTAGTVRRDIEVIRLYNQLVRMPLTRVNIVVFEYGMDLPVKGSWAANFMSLVRCLDMEENVTQRRSLPLQQVRQKLNEMYGACLTDATEQKPKLRTYVSIMENCGMEGYLKANLDKHKCSLIGQLRLGVLSLQIELGRFQCQVVKQKNL